MLDLFLQLQNNEPFIIYFVLFLSAIIENLFPPVPGDTVTVIGAYLVGRGILSFWGVFISTTLGSIAGFMVIFLFAYWLGWNSISKLKMRWLKTSHLNRVKKWSNKYGYWIILFNRFLSGARSVISFVSGLSKMNILAVFILASIGGAIWNGVLIYFGSTIGKNWEEIMAFIKIYNQFVIAIIVALLITFISYKIYKKKQATN